jgi:hypothetical protein
MRHHWIVIAAVLASASAEARLYQWNNPNTGTPQLSGTPPAWYRQGTGGPRITVYDRGRLIDDTSRKVDEAERLRLREEAFGIQEREDTLAAEIKKAEKTEKAAAPLEARPGAQPPLPVGLAGAGGSLPAVILPKPGETAIGPGGLSEVEVTRMKEIITSWEQQRTAQAQALVGTQPVQPAVNESMGEPGIGVPVTTLPPPPNLSSADLNAVPAPAAGQAPPGIVGSATGSNLAPNPENQSLRNYLQRALNADEQGQIRQGLQRY